MDRIHLHKNTQLYSILDEYLLYIDSKIEKMKGSITTISTNIAEYSEKFNDETISKEDIDNIIILQNEFIDLGKEKKYLTGKLLKVVEFNTQLSLNKITKDDEMFNTLMNHFIDVEKYEFCSMLETIIKETFD